MDVNEMLTQVSDEYRKLGYLVLIHPDKDHLPGGLPLEGIDLVAQKGEDRVAIEVKERHQLSDLTEVRKRAELVEAHRGWRFEFVVFPREQGPEIPTNGVDRGDAILEALFDEVSLTLGVKAFRSAFVIAWSAVEAAMRAAARREGLQIERATPRLLLKSLYSAGVISNEDFDRVERSFQARNALVHGLEPEQMDRDDIQFLLEFAKGLANTEPAKADS
jgi:hypothetical protein